MDENSNDNGFELNLIFENIADILIQTDKVGTIQKVSASAQNILGYKKDELIDQNICNFIKIAHQDHADAIKDIKDLKNCQKDRVEFLNKSGSYISIEFSTIEIDYEGSKAYLSIGRDISEQIEMQKQSILHKKIFQHSTEGIVISDKNNRIITVNDAFTKITKYDKSEAIGQDPGFLKSGKYDKKFYQKMWNDIEQKGSWKGEIWNRDKNNQIFPEFLSIDTVKDENGEIENYIAIFADLSEIKESEQKLKHLALYDQLTNLPNRTFLSNGINHAIEVAKRDERKLSVIFLDIDNFKVINDIYGHDKGDEIIIESANRLKRSLRKEDIIAKFGGDEFVILVERVKNGINVAQLAQKIIKLFDEPFSINGIRHKLTVSIGISFFPDNATTGEKLISLAETAMYEVKKSGKNRFFFYTKQFTEKIEKELFILNSFENALKNDEFELYYQPQISLNNGNLTSLEALVRWNHPTLGHILPDTFIPIAEKSHFIIDISKWVIKKACIQVSNWNKKGLYDKKISINISAKQIKHTQLDKIIKEILQESGLNPKNLELEITESVAMEDPKTWINIFDKIKDMGVGIAIDDFGKGYSSLSYLKKIPITTLKIDKSFIDDITDNDESKVIVNTILTLSELLNFKTVIEGIETQEQIEYLIDLDKPIIVQGNYFSKPLSKEDMESFFLEFMKNPYNLSDNIK